MSELPPQTLTLRNETEASFEVYVEVNPDRYILKPKDEMLFEAPATPQEHEAFAVVLYKGSVQIYPNGGFPTGVWINNIPVEPDHKTEVG